MPGWGPEWWWRNLTAKSRVLAPGCRGERLHVSTLDNYTATAALSLAESRSRDSCARLWLVLAAALQYSLVSPCMQSAVCGRLTAALPPTTLHTPHSISIHDIVDILSYPIMFKFCISGDHRCLNFSSSTEVFRLHFRCELQVPDIKGCWSPVPRATCRVLAAAHNWGYHGHGHGAQWHPHQEWSNQVSIQYPGQLFRIN